MKKQIDFMKACSVLLILGLLLPCVFASCKKKTKVPEEPTKTEEEVNNSFTAVFGRQDYGGEVFRMAGVEASSWEQYYDMRIVGNAESTDILDVALYKRNAAVEKSLNIQIEYVPLTEWLFTLSDYLNLCNLNGSCPFDTLLMVDRDAVTAALNGDLYLYNDIPTVNLSNSWWSEVNEDISMGGKYFFAYGNDSLHFLESANVLVFNKTLAGAAGIEDLYALVESHEWTLDKMFEVAAKVAADDGDGIINDYDTFGIITEADMFFPGIWQCSGIRLVEKDANDMPYFNVPGNENFYTLMGNAFDQAYRERMIFQTLYDNPTNYTQAAFGNYITAGDVMFADGHALFRTVNLRGVMDLRRMDSDFGILPYPMGFEWQTDYISRVYSGFPTVVPKTSTKVEMTGVVLEALACLANEYYLPDYYDTMLKGHSVSDPESAKMLDIVFSTRTMDLGDTLWYDYIRLRYQDTLAKDRVKDLDGLTGAITRGVNMIINSCNEKLQGG